MSRRTTYQAFALLGLLTAVVLSGCQNSSAGIVNLYISGIPASGVDNVVLAIRGIELGGDGGNLDLPFGSEQLVDIEGSRTLILDSYVAPVSGYKWVRFDIDPADSFVIASNGDRYGLDVASQYQSTGDFLVGESVTINLLSDIDLRVALTSQTKDGVRVYTLQELSRLVNLDAVGNITGTVSSGVMIGNVSVNDPNCDPAVYVYQGDGAVPEGFFVTAKGGTTPFASAALVLHVNQDIYSFNAALLPPGNYTAAVTCSAADATGSKNLDFTPTKNAVVTSGNITSLTFTPPSP